MSLLFLLIIPAVIALHLIRRQRADLEISSTFLWEEVLREYRKRFFFQTLVRNLPLLLQILVAFFIALGLANVLVASRKTAKEENIIIVLDTSASMKTATRGTTRGATRFDDARKRAMAYIQELPERSRIMVVAGGAAPGIVSPFSQDKLLVRDVLQDITVTDEPGNIESVLITAAGLGNPNQEMRIVLFSDGAFAMDNTELISAIPLELIAIGEDEGNVAITGFQFRKPINRRHEYEIMVRLKNYHSDSYTGTLDISAESGPLLAEDIRLIPFEEKTMVFPYDGLLAQRVKASIKPGDRFMTDNTAYAVLAPEGPAVVNLVTTGNFFLERLLKVHPNIALAKEPEGTVANAITIYDGELPSPDAQGHYILIGVIDESLGFSATGIQENPIVTGWDIDHPILQNVDLTDLTVHRSLKVPRSNEITSIVHSGDSSLIYAFEDTERTVIGFSFAISDSDLPLRAAFPILINNALSWLNPTALRGGSAQALTGAIYAAPIAAGVKSVSVTDPKGITWSEPVKDGYALIGGLRYSGFYTISTPVGSSLFAANLLDEDESDITSRFALPEPENPRVEPDSNISTRGKSYKPLWIALISVAVALLLVEWLVWIRRKA